YTTEKLLSDFKGKVASEKIDSIQKEIGELKELLKPATKDVPKIKEKLEAVNKIVQEASTELYQKAQQSAAQAADGNGGSSGGEGTGGSNYASDDEASGKSGSKKEKVVDAEYEVKDDKGDSKKKARK
ncbi:hypothetical protein HYV83_06030, partial [Candidatus Woesearchaeota archaeon]|nr:hypothetical protein [Candidatus Woesearchaeota archaeon]